MFKKFFLAMVVLIFGTANLVKAGVPSGTFEELLVKAELNPHISA